MHRVLEGIIRNDRVASAYLFVGPPDSNKKEDAEEFADRLGAKKIDKIILEPRGASFKIDQVREIQQTVRYGPAAGRYLCVIIERSDEMTDEAAAAFLKTLEEPPAGVVFILLVAREDRIPSTIVSRCQKIIFGEKEKAWQPDPELAPFYQKISLTRGQKISELFGLSMELEKEKERIEALLYDLAFYAKEELKNLKLVRVLLDAIKNLKKKANLKLALDVACLKMSEI